MSEEFSDDFSEEMSEEISERISEGIPEDFADDFEVEVYEEEEGGRSFLIWAGALLLLFIAISACMLVYMITRGDEETALADQPAQETATAITVLNMTTEANNALVTLTVEAIEASGTEQAVQQEQEAEEAEQEMIAATATAEVVEATLEVEATATAEAESTESGTGGDPGQGGVGEGGEGSAGGESTDEQVTDPPTLTGPWVETLPDGSESIFQTADDLLNNDIAPGAAELLNLLPDSPTVDDPAAFLAALTPEVLDYMAEKEDGFVSAIDPEILEMMSPESLAYLLEEHSDEIAPEVAERIAVIAASASEGGEGGDGAESTDEQATDAPDLSGPWVEPGPDGSDPVYETADDLLNNDIAPGAAELLNMLPDTPQIDDPAPYIEALSPEVIDYIADNEDGFVAAVEPEILEMMSPETLTFILEEYPDDIDAEVAERLADIAAGEGAAGGESGEGAAGGEGSEGAAGGTGGDGTLPSTGTSALTIAVVALGLVAVLVVARRLRTL